MLNLIVSAAQRVTDYPMPFTDTTPSTFDQLTGGIVISILVFAVLIATFAIWTMTEEEDCGKPVSEWALRAAFVSGCVIVIAATWLACLTSVAHETDTRTDVVSRSAYDKSVISWLKSDYGITVDAHALARLTDGATLVVDYEGEETMIEFAERADRGLAVRIPDGRLLLPASAR